MKHGRQPVQRNPRNNYSNITASITADSIAAAIGVSDSDSVSMSELMESSDPAALDILPPENLQATDERTADELIDTNNPDTVNQPYEGETMHD